MKKFLKCPNCSERYSKKHNHNFGKYKVYYTMNKECVTMVFTCLRCKQNFKMVIPLEVYCLEKIDKDDEVIS